MANGFFNDRGQIKIDSVTLNLKSDLTIEQLSILKCVVEKAFKEIGDKLECRNIFEHKIVTTSVHPIKQRYYPVSPAIQTL